MTEAPSQTDVQSRPALYRCAKRPQRQPIARHSDVCYSRWACAILTLHVLLVAFVAFRNSPTDNEPAHLAAGIRIWTHGRFDLYRVNPPLIKAIAAIPVICLGCKTDWKHLDEELGARSEFRVGADFIAANGDRAFFLVSMARAFCIPFSVLGGYICLKWASTLYGRRSGLVALTFWCFCPNVMGNAALITPDVGATALAITACYLFWQWLRNPCWWRAAVAGSVLGVAELAKFTLLVLPVTWGVIWAIWYCGLSRRCRLKTLCVQASQLMSASLVGIYVLNCGYLFEGSFSPLASFHLTSRTFASKVDTMPDAASITTSRPIASSLSLVPLPKDYVLGIDAQAKDFERFSSPSYLRGTFRERGWWYYYCYGLLIKLPIGTLFIGGLVCLCKFGRPWRSSGVGNDIAICLPPVVVFVLVSSQTGINHHFRYVLPVLPFAFVWLSQIVATLGYSASRARLCVVAMGWSMLSVMSIYPHNLSYFNELVGGPLRGHAHMIHSSIDWGQDLLYLKSWIVSTPNAKPRYVAYFGGFTPWEGGLAEACPVVYRHEGHGPTLSGPGWYAVSVNILRGARWPPPSCDLTCLQQLRPAAFAGYSIYIYHVTQEDIVSIENSCVALPPVTRE